VQHIASLVITTSLNSLPPLRKQLLALFPNNPNLIASLLGLTLAHIAKYRYANPT